MGRMLVGLVCVVVITRLMSYAAAMNTMPPAAGEASALTDRPARDLVHDVSPQADPPNRAAAEWRSQAQQRIEQHRKAELRLVVVDSDGRPIPAARVSVQMRRHAFAFGAAVPAELVLDEQSPDAQHYLAALKELFNSATPSGALAWPHMEDDPNRSLRLVERLGLMGLDVRGASLAPPAAEALPEPIRDQYASMHLSDPASAQAWLLGRLHERIESAAGPLAGRVTSWDVWAPGDGGETSLLFDPDQVAELYATARRCDPRASLLCDAGPLGRATAIPALRESIRSLVDRGSPVGGVSVQARLGGSATDWQRLADELEALSELGLPLYVSELSVEAADEQRQADELHDALLLAFSQPQVRGVTLWGLWEGRSLRPGAALFRVDWSSKPAAQTYRQLVLGEWWTRASLESDARGLCSTRGFLGDYEITVSHAGRTESAQVRLGPGGATAKLVLPAAE